MTEKLPRLTAAEAMRALKMAGFFCTRQSGSPKFTKTARVEE